MIIILICVWYFIYIIECKCMLILILYTFIYCKIIFKKIKNHKWVIDYNPINNNIYC